MRINPFAGWVCLCLFALPLSARASRVAVAPVDYAQLGESAPAPDAAIQVENKIAEGAREAGYEVLRGAVVADALGAVPECAPSPRSRVCLEKVAERLGVDEAIAVSVSDEDHASYRIELLHARRDKVVDERTAGFFVVLEWLRGTIALTLQKPAPAAEGPEKSDLSNLSDQSDKPDQPDGADKSDKSEKSDRRHLKPWLFWTSVGVTGALAIAWGATDIAAWKSPAKTDGERDRVERLKVADGALLGCALGAAVATTVVFFFTDFDKGEAFAQKRAALAPFALPDGGGLVLEGRF